MSKRLLSLIFKTNLSTLRNAILANDINRISRILDLQRQHLGKDIDQQGNTALLFALHFASFFTVRVLLEQGAHPDQANFLTAQTPLNVLVSEQLSHNAKHRYELALLLLDHEAYIDKSSPFYYQDEQGNERTIRETPLMTAVRLKNHRFARLLLERKANVNYTDTQTGYRPIHLAIANGDVEMFDLLSEAGVSSRSTVTDDGNTLLHWFCSTKSNDQQTLLLTKLLTQKCDVNARNDQHHTPLMLAAQCNMMNTCQLLVSAGADISKRDADGHRAIDLARNGSQCWRFFRDLHSRKKPVEASRSRSKERESLLYAYDFSQHKLQSSRSNIFGQGESDMKCKRMWEKLLETKEKIRRTRDFSQQKNTDRMPKGPATLIQS